MTRAAGCFLVLLVTVSTLAQRTDLALTTSLPDSIRVSEDLPFRLTVENRGQGAARNVRVFRTVGGSVLAGPCRDVLLIDILQAGESRSYDCSVRVDDPWPTFLATVHFAADSDTPDENLANNLVSVTLKVITPPDLVIRAAPLLERVMPGVPFPLEIEYYNRAFMPALETALTIDAPNGFGIPPPNCTVSGNRARCSLGTVNNAASQELTIPVYAADDSNTSLSYELSIESPTGEYDSSTNRFRPSVWTFLTFFVTSTEDTGPGSLRAIIEEANASCRLTNIVCAIAFRIPTRPTGRWYTIRLASPLPQVDIRSLRLDATTQTAFNGDRNHLGPEIELNGSALESGDGLRIKANCERIDVKGLAINGFPGSGLIVDRHSCYFAEISTISGNYIGCDPTGRRAIPNGRGIEISGDRWSVRDNVISGNRQSGVFIHKGYVEVFRNVIGLNQTLTAPLPNGASGVYVGDGGIGTQIIRNYIGFNHHFGVAVSPLARWTRIDLNSIQANHQLGIDVGLDGLSPTTPVRIPTIVDASYVNGETVIRVTHEPVASIYELDMSFYANDEPDPSGFGEGQYFLGRIAINPGVSTVFRYRGDLRGKWVTATATRAPGDVGSFTTSEFSRAVEVK